MDPRPLPELLALLDVRDQPSIVTIRAVRPTDGTYEATTPRMKMIIFEEERVLLLGACAIDQDPQEVLGRS